jgi:UDP-4-amino-4,6-dideoxy-N-acetyl-beta-L-altrosamine N-acetyltransferase
MLVAATEADLAMIRTWRNHPRVRQTHFYTREITPEHHLGWWRSVENGDRKVLIFHFAERPAGVVHFEQFSPEEGSAHWGFFLDTEGLEERRELLAAWLQLEQEAVDYAFDVLGLTWLRGETLTDNTVVRQLHKRFGFTESPAFSREVDGVVHHAVTTEMHADARRRTRR